jgi:Zn finger protein HypA/HybF involved in hydrogenase expression
MFVLCFYCSHCGYEDIDIEVAFSATYADTDWFICPHCGAESSQVIFE